MVYYDAILYESTIVEESIISVILRYKNTAMLTTGGCPKTILSIKDALEALEGRWRLLILFALSSGSMRFGELSREVPGITDKMLAKELKSLEAHRLITREVQAIRRRCSIPSQITAAHWSA